MAESESQKRANKKWKTAHKNKTRLYSDKSATRRYIKHTKNKVSLRHFINLIKQRLREL